eukprot:1851527-Pleurochrysis_carterae.AAC.2
MAHATEHPGRRQLRCSCGRSAARERHERSRHGRGPAPPSPSTPPPTRCRSGNRIRPPPHLASWTRRRTTECWPRRKWRASVRLSGAGHGGAASLQHCCLLIRGQFAPSF